VSLYQEPQIELSHQIGIQTTMIASHSSKLIF